MTSSATVLWLTVLAADLDVGADQTYPTIGEAIAAAVPGDVIRVHPGTYVEDLDLSFAGVEGNPIRIEAVRPLAAIVQGTIDIDGTD